MLLSNECTSREARERCLQEALGHVDFVRPDVHEQMSWRPLGRVAQARLRPAKEMTTGLRAGRPPWTPRCSGRPTACWSAPGGASPCTGAELD